jgi:hypothetical protein
VHADVPSAIARELERLAGEEPPSADFRSEPTRAERYRSLLQECAGSAHPIRTFHGPGFEFPQAIDERGGCVRIHDERQLARRKLGLIAYASHWNLSA